MSWFISYSVEPSQNLPDGIIRLDSFSDAFCVTEEVAEDWERRLGVLRLAEHDGFNPFHAAETAFGERPESYRLIPAGVAGAEPEYVFLMKDGSEKRVSQTELQERCEPGPFQVLFYGLVEISHVACHETLGGYEDFENRVLTDADFEEIARRCRNFETEDSDLIEDALSAVAKARDCACSGKSVVAFCLV